VTGIGGCGLRVSNELLTESVRSHNTFVEVDLKLQLDLSLKPNHTQGICIHKFTSVPGVHKTPKTGMSGHIVRLI